MRRMVTTDDARWYRVSTRHYDDIPSGLMQGTKRILEFGSATGINQIASKHRDFFIENNIAGLYRGVDTRMYGEKYLNIEQGDIRSFYTAEKFDVIPAIHVIEHIEIQWWKPTFSRLRYMLADGGCLIIGVPHNEPVEDQTNEEHVVFNITRKLLAHYLPDAEIREIRNYRFHEDGARFLWAFIRFVKRWLTRHPTVTGRSRLLAVWRKGAKR